MKRLATAQAGETAGVLACRAWRLICGTNAHVRFCIVAVCDHAIACRKPPCARRMRTCKAARDVLCFTARHPAARALQKPPMCENKIRAARKRYTIVLRAKRRCTIGAVCPRRMRSFAVRHGRDARFELARQTKHVRRRKCE